MINHLTQTHLEYEHLYTVEGNNQSVGPHVIAMPAHVIQTYIVDLPSGEHLLVAIACGDLYRDNLPASCAGFSPQRPRSHICIEIADVIFYGMTIAMSMHLLLQGQKS